MATGEFSRHVVVALGLAGTMRVVSTVIEASECLVDEFWPDDVSSPYSEALHICLLAIRGKRSTEAARLAFIAAARDSDILIIGGQQ
nr:DUF982 domain-containing protein [Aminobacter anthyllidis]